MSIKIGHGYHHHAHGKKWGRSIHWRLFSIEWSNIRTMYFISIWVLGFWISYCKFKQGY